MNIPIPIRDELREESEKICTRRDDRGRKSKLRIPSCVEYKDEPFGNNADTGEVVGITWESQEESDMRKKEELAPESEIAVQAEGVARDEEAAITCVELHKTGNISLFDGGSPTTLSPYLGRTHLDKFPPTGLEAVAAVTCPSEGLLHALLECPQIP